jgi:glycerol-3-phosphate dehydrogenase subunit C
MYDEDTMLVANWTYDFNEFLLTLQDDGSLNNNFDEIPLQLPYHVPCQYKGHRLGRPGVEILGLIPELEIMESKAVCCGIAGTYGYKQEKYEISMAVGESLFEFIEETGAPLVVCDSETCRWQITHATGVPCIHPVELIATAYGHKAEPPLALVLKQLGLKSVHLGEEK